MTSKQTNGETVTDLESDRHRVTDIESDRLRESKRERMEFSSNDKIILIKY